LCLIGFNYAQPFLLAAAINALPRMKDNNQKSDGYGLIGATGLIYLGIAVSTSITMYQQEPKTGADIHSPVSTPSIPISHDVSRGNGFPHLHQDSGNASGRAR
jgi:hypothetical protein